MVVAEPDIGQRDVTGPPDSAGWAAEVAPNPIEAASLEFAGSAFERVKARLPDPGVDARQQVEPVLLPGEAALLLDFVFDGHGCLPCSAVWVRRRLKTTLAPQPTQHPRRQPRPV